MEAIFPDDIYISMRIYVKAFTGNAIILDVGSFDTFNSIKIKIEGKTGIPVSQQCLIFYGKQLEDGLTVSDHNIRNGDTLHLMLRLGVSEIQARQKAQMAKTHTSLDRPGTI